MITENPFKNYWGWMFAIGIILIIIGVLAIAAPFVATFASVVALGWLLIIAGVAQLLFTFSARQSSDFLLHSLIALFTLLIGILMVTHPTTTAMTLTILLAAFFFTLGLFRIYSALLLRFSNWGWVLVGGIIAIILGILILVHWPSSALWVIGLFIGIDLVFTGWAFILSGLLLKKA